MGVRTLVKDIKEKQHEDKTVSLKGKEVTGWSLFGGLPGHHWGRDVGHENNGQCETSPPG